MSNPLHLARVGTFTDMHGQDVALTPALLAQLAASYDPAIYQAPLVVGHPKANAPAFGWLDAIEATPEGLFGTPINVDPFFADAVRSGRYPKRSLSFWPADHPQSPTPGQPYIRHLGVLGAVPPAIPGLRGADLADPDAGITSVDFSADPDPMTPPEEPPMTDPDPVALAAQVADLAAQAEALTARETALLAREAEIAAHAEGIRRAEAVAFCDALANKAQIRPTDIPALAELMLRLDADEPAPCFAAATDPQQATAPGAWLRSWLSGMPPLVELSEVATHGRSGPHTAPTDAEAVTRARAYRAKQAAAGNPISFTAAVAAVDLNLDAPE
ncbi:MAG: hypothetical protein KAY71_04015 [Chromatiaceae bacterium]|jgi:hypothetical protein|nr:hypothetical protein [Chromatiaceae bacterium]MBP7983562.1 hypothetical protein [Chromatiaceae bacterium]MBP8024566.1 hypothetical protein [Chromatiaceae bacterium]